MGDKVSEISKESRLERAMRGDSMAGMMLIIVFVAMVNGMIIGAGIITMVYHGEKYDAMRTAYEVNNIYQNQVEAELIKLGIDIERPSLSFEE